MSDEMLAAIDLLTLELGHVTNGDGDALEDEAIIFFKEDVDCTCEIRVSSPGAHAIAAKIVETWNNRPQPLTPAQQAPNRGALLDLLSNAYNEGFCEGMRGSTSSKGGWPWSSRKQKYGELLDKALSLPSTERVTLPPQACDDCANTGWCHANGKCYLKGCPL